MAQNCANMTRIYAIKHKSNKKNTSSAITQQECRQICTFDSPLKGCKWVKAYSSTVPYIHNSVCKEIRIIPRLLWLWTPTAYSQTKQPSSKHPDIDQHPQCSRRNSKLFSRKILWHYKSLGFYHFVSHFKLFYGIFVSGWPAAAVSCIVR